MTRKSGDDSIDLRQCSLNIGQFSANNKRHFLVLIVDHSSIIFMSMKSIDFLSSKLLLVHASSNSRFRKNGYECRNYAWNMKHFNCYQSRSSFCNWFHWFPSHISSTNNDIIYKPTNTMSFVCNQCNKRKKNSKGFNWIEIENAHIFIRTDNIEEKFSVNVFFYVTQTDLDSVFIFSFI